MENKKGFNTQFTGHALNALSVAIPIATEVENNSRYGRPFAQKGEGEVRPVLIGISCHFPTDGITFRFESGISVRLNDALDAVIVRYYPLDKMCERTGEKKEEVWGSEKLDELKKARPWPEPIEGHIKKGKFKIERLPFYIRMAMQVDLAVADDLAEDRVRLFSIDSVMGSWKKETEVHFRFASADIRVFLYDMSVLDDNVKAEDWVVTRAQSMYRRTGENISWDAEKLRELKERRPWYHPHVVGMDQVEKEIKEYVASMLED